MTANREISIDSFDSSALKFEQNKKNSQQSLADADKNVEAQDDAGVNELVRKKDDSTLNLVV